VNGRSMPVSWLFIQWIGMAQKTMTMRANKSG
jgi:hypothetical protein